MFQKVLLFFMMINGVLFSFSSSIILMSICLGLKILIMSILLGVSLKSFWFSYLLFLVIVGGLLILLLYLVSLTSSSIPYSYKLKETWMVGVMLLMLGVSIASYNFYFNYFPINVSFFLEYSLDLEFFLNKLYNSPSNQINIFLISYLFLMLLVVVKITTLFGPFRI